MIEVPGAVQNPGQHRQRAAALPTFSSLVPLHTQFEPAVTCLAQLCNGTLQRLKPGKTRDPQDPKNENLRDLGGSYSAAHH